MIKSLQPVSFKGIYGSATNIEGEKIVLSINNPETVLKARNVSSPDSDIFEISLSENGNKPRKAGKFDENLYKNITIDEVTDNSKVILSGVKQNHIGELRDSASLLINKCFANIGTISGENVTIDVEGRTAALGKPVGFEVKDNQETFNLRGIVVGNAVKVSKKGSVSCAL